MTRQSEAEQPTRGIVRRALRLRGRIAGLQYDVGIRVVTLADAVPESVVPAVPDGETRGLAGAREVGVVAAPGDAGRPDADPAPGALDQTLNRIERMSPSSTT
jgi:hypothetical protein